MADLQIYPRTCSPSQVFAGKSLLLITETFPYLFDGWMGKVPSQSQIQFEFKIFGINPGLFESI